MKKGAFVLSEVLIALGVIGIIAAMTLPILIKNYNNYIITQKLKKAYNTVSNGIRMSEIDNGYMKDWPTGTNMNMKEYYNTYFKPYFKGIKLCTNTVACGYKNFNNQKWTGANWTVGTDITRLLFQITDGTVIFVSILPLSENLYSHTISLPTGIIPYSKELPLIDISPINLLYSTGSVISPSQSLNEIESSLPALIRFVVLYFTVPLLGRISSFLIR